MNSTVTNTGVDSPAFTVPIFGGQGSRSLFSDKSIALASQDAQTHTGAVLLSQCHRALISELGVLEAEDRRSLGFGVTDFPRPDTLVNVPSELQNNPTLLGTTLCLFQLLRYCGHVDASSASFEDAAQNVLESAGFCFGVLPAAVVSASKTSLDFITYGVEAFRLAFWIGVRCTAFAKTLANDAEDATSDRSWSLVLVGVGKEEALNKLEDFHKENSGSLLHLAAISSHNCVTISGPAPILARFKESHVSPACTTRFAHIDILFHGGSALEDVMQQVLADASRRSIGFPTVAQLHASIRSTANGSSITRTSAHGGSLLNKALEMILIHPVDWETALAAVTAEARTASQSARRPVNLLSFGPGSSSSLCGPVSAYKNTPDLRPFDVSVVPNAFQKEKNSTAKHADIAIVGMGVKFPKGNDVDELWESLKQGLNAVEEIPETRFDVSNYYDPDGSKKGRRMGTKYGNFLDSPWEFDNLFFNISPREAKAMDPQQRVLLQTAFAAMENAGYVADSTESFKRDSFGCYVGVATGDYVDSMRDDIDVYYSTGTLRAFLSGRISYAFKLSGPSIVVDTACSSSLIAVYQAIRALQVGDCKAALAGGVNVLCGPDMYLGLDRAHFLSPTGNCKPFDASADGYCRAEGCGMFVLKRLDDAIADNDQILGVIKGIEANQSGNAHSITHPHSPTQQDLFHRLLKNTGIDPTSVGVIEAHGTGTQAGDPAEVESLRQVFGVSRSPDNPVYITSIKGNVGHCEAAAGAAGLAKLLLMLRHKEIPVQSSLKTLNPRINLPSDSNVIIPRANTEWKSTQQTPRRALLNNFGAAGSNAAMIIEEYPRTSEYKPSKSNYLFAFSAKSDVALEALRQKYIDFLEGPGRDVPLPSICYTATARRQLLGKRIAVSATSHEDLIAKLRSATPKAAGSTPSNPVVFVFSGQGSQYVSMGRELLSTSPLFKDIVMRCHKELVDMGYAGVLAILGAEPDTEVALDAAAKIEAFQCAVFVLEYALAKLWMSWNVVPAAVMGHSLGEYAALAISGALKLSDALHIVAARARLMAQNCASGASGMLAVNMCSERITQIIAEHKDAYEGVSVACLNSPNDTVVAGPVDKLDALKAHLKDNSICKSARVDVPFGYHSVAMEPILEPLTKLAKKIQFLEPTIPVISNVYGTKLARSDLAPDYFSKHARQPVRFFEGLQLLSSEFAADPVFVEVGPHPITLPMVKTTLSDRKVTGLPSLNKQKTPWTTLTSTLADLYTSGFSVDWRKIYDGDSVTVVDLPAYPLAKTEFRVPYKEPSGRSEVAEAAPAPVESRYSLLTGAAANADGYHAFSTKVSLLSVLITGHIVGGSALCPASVYHELAMEAAEMAFERGNGDVFILADIDYSHPLLYDADSPDKTVEIILQTARSTVEGSVPFEVVSYASDGARTPHCTGVIKVQTAETVKNKFARQAATAKRQSLLIGAQEDVEKINTRLMYDVIFTRVVTYSKGYQSVRSMSISNNGSEGYATVRLPQELKDGRYVAQPVFMDTLLHAAGFIANNAADPSEACICSKVESVKVLYDEVNWDDTFTVYCNTLPWMKSTVLAEAYALDSQGKVVAAIKGMHFKRLRLAQFKAHLAHLIKKPADKSDLGQQVQSRLAAAPMHRNMSSSSTSSNTSSRGPPVGDIVAKVIAETCGISAEAFKPTQKLEELGVDSLMTIEICETLKAKFPGIDIDTDSLALCATAQDFEEAISSRQIPTPTDSTISEVHTPAQLEPLTFDNASSGQVPDIRALLAATVGVKESDVTPTTELAELGLDSLTSIELLHGLHEQCQLDIPMEKFLECVSFQDLEKLVSSLLAPAPVQQHALVESPDVERMRKAMKMTDLPVRLQESHSRNLPFFIIHDGSGLCNKYSNIGPLDRNVFGFFNPRFFSNEAWTGGLPEMASYYAAVIAQTSAEPYILGGWSFGGVVAFEAARHLRKQGKKVAGIVLIDSPCPVNHDPLPADIIASVSRSNFASAAAKQLESLVAAQFKSNTANLVAYNPVYQDGTPEIVLLRSREGFKAKGVSSTHKWLMDRSDPADAVSGWEKLVGRKVAVLDIPGNHFEPFEKQNVAGTTDAIKRACAMFGGRA